MIKEYLKNRKRELQIVGISLFNGWAFAKVGEFDEILFLISIVTFSLLIPENKEQKEITVSVSGKGIAHHIQTDNARKARSVGSRR
jgi:hypothetical protein